MANARELIWKLSAKDSGMSKTIEELDGKFTELNPRIGATENMLGKFGSNMKIMGSNMSAFGGRVSSIGKNIQGFGAKMTRAMLPVSIAMGKAIYDSLNLDTAIRQVTTLTDENVLPVEQIKKDVREISDASGRSQAEIANAMYDALSSGVDQSKVKDFVKSGVDLVRAGFTDMPTVIDATTTALNAYGDAAPEVSKIHDIFVKTQDLGKITVDELGKSIGRVIPTAAAAGVGLEQLGASYSMLTAKGMNAELATTTMNSMLAELSSTGSKSDKALRKMTGKSFKQLTKEGKNIGEVLEVIQESAKGAGLELSDMFGNINAGKAANSILSEGAEAYTKVLESMKKADGATIKNAMKMMGPAEKLQIAKTRLENSMIDAGGILAPHLVTLAEGISNLVDKFSSLDSETQSMIVEWIGMAIAIGPVVYLVGTLGTVFGGAVGILGNFIGIIGMVIGAIAPLASGFFGLLGAIGPIGWALMAIVGVCGYLMSNWDSVKAKADELGGGFKGYLMAAIQVVIGGFSGLGSTALGVLNSIKEKWNEVKEFVKHPIQGVISLAQKGFAALSGGSSGKTENSAPKRVPHATGLEKVPFDNYPADLHKDEMVLTADAANAFRELGGSKNYVPNNIRESKIDNKSFMSNSPNIVVNVYGERTRDEAFNIGQKVREELDAFFKEMQLQRV